MSVISSVATWIPSIVTHGDENSVLYSIITIVLEFAIMPMQVGLSSYFIKLVKGKKVDVVEELFSKYRSEYIWNIMLVTFVAGLIIFGFSLLLIIPGIIYSIKYTMLSFVLAEQTSKEMKEKPAYKESEKLMDGHKWEYVVFQLSFLGWLILCGLTLGILCIWIVPYMTVANVMWYEELKKISK